MTKKIVFLTGTRADFGKLKSLIEILCKDSSFDVHIFATGMHMDAKYGYTVHEIEKCGYSNIYKFINHDNESMMDMSLSRTIEGFAGYIRLVKPDLIVIHGDRIEALAGATVGALNNILIAHVEGGELSGTVDELIRHAVSKLSHTHFVANSKAKKRLMQMGEKEDSIFTIGSPDMDVMLSEKLPSWETVKLYYNIDFDEFALAMFHPVTTEIDVLDHYAEQYVNALELSELNYVVIFPNNDRGSDVILSKLKRLHQNPKFKIFPSTRFEYFLSILKKSRFIIGNSSAGIREAPCYGIPTVNIGTRQNGRSSDSDIINTSYEQHEICSAIKQALTHTVNKKNLFGDGNSAGKFVDVLNSRDFWMTSRQKNFLDHEV